jgi:hypothetical protein
MYTMMFIMMICLTGVVAVACCAVMFMIADLIFSHRISDSIKSWYDRRFGAQ